MARVIPQQWIDMTTGRLTVEATLYLNDLENGTDTDSPGINTVLAGVNRAEAKVDGVIDGTQVLATVTTTDAGNIPTALTALGSTSGASIGLSVSAEAVAFITGGGAAATNSVTASASFGTGPWTYAWAYVTGDVFTVSNPSDPTTNFSTTLIDGGQKYATYSVTATDSLAATRTADVPVTAFSTPVS